MLSISYFVFLALISVMVIWTHNLFMSILSSIILFINVALVFLMLGFEFFALINLMIYVGALAVLFMFVIMLQDIQQTELRAYNRGFSSFAIMALYGLKLRLWNMEMQQCSHNYTSTIERMDIIAEELFMTFADVLLFNSIVLTVALFGALLIAYKN